MAPDDTPQDESIAALARESKDKPGALLPILHAIQNDLGFVPPSAVPIIAEELNLSRAEVHGVVSFYHDFRSEKPGKHIVRICQAESCQAMGSAGLTAYAQEQLGVPFRETTRDSVFTLEPVYCLGNCACSPSVMLDGEVYGRVTPARFSEILEEARRGE